MATQERQTDRQTKSRDSKRKRGRERERGGGQGRFKWKTDGFYLAAIMSATCNMHSLV